MRVFASYARRPARMVTPSAGVIHTTKAFLVLSWRSGGGRFTSSTATRFTSSDCGAMVIVPSTPTDFSDPRTVYSVLEAQPATAPIPRLPTTRAAMTC